MRRSRSGVLLVVVGGLTLLVVILMIGGFLVLGTRLSTPVTAAGPGAPEGPVGVGGPGAADGPAAADGPGAAGSAGVNSAAPTESAATTRAGSRAGSSTGPAGAAGPSGAAGPTATPSVIAHQASIEQLQPGDCIQSIDGTHISRLPVVDCTTPHEVQLAGIFTPKKGPYPGHAALVRTGNSGCIPVVRGLLRPDAPATAVVALVPAESLWTSGDRRILCFAAADNARDLSRSVLDPITI